MEPLRIVIVDDQVMFRENLKIVIELCMHDAKVVGLAANGQEGLQVIEETKPNLVIMDINMPVMSGVECVRKLREAGNEVNVLMLTMFDEDEYMLESLQLGAVGYILKDTEPEKFTAALQSLQSGCTLLSQQVAKRIASSLLQKNDNTKPENVWRESLIKLTQREQEILRHIGLGEDNQEISSKLFLSEGTVRNYVSAIYEKLDLKDRAQAVRFAIKAELIDE